MKVSIIGSGYVGLTQGIGLAKLGHKVICRDVIKEKVEKINSGNPGIYEPKMEEYLKEVLGKNFEATLDLDYAIKNSDISFLCVPTPSSDDGSMETKYIEKASQEIGQLLKEKNYHVIVVKSTVIPGTTEEIVIKALEKYSGKKVGKDFGVCMNPEFLREGKALEDFFNPDRIVIGEFDKKSGDTLKELYKNYKCPVLRTNLKTAEMIKYVSNAFLATKISFSNEIGNICKSLGIDVYDVMKGVGLDNRIGPKFLDAGLGFGGSCFPKDVSALKAKGHKLNCETKILDSILDVNKKQRFKIIDLLEKELGNLKGKTISILGLAFKPDTDDIREAPSVDIIKVLQERGAKIHVYDPRAIENMKRIYSNIKYFNSPQEALGQSDACLLLTEWEEFKKLTNQDFAKMRNKLIIEGRKILDKSKVSNFEGVCW